MFGSGKIRALEDQLSGIQHKLENVEKEKTNLQQQLTTATEKIQELEKKLAGSEGAELQEKARQTIVEYEGLKALYSQKNRELDESRESVEESFAREAANKRHDLSEEIRMNREDNQNRVAETVKTFAGSYQYYLDQIRVLMDALSQAAKETGETLFAGDPGDIRERFGASILGRLRSDADALKQENGDVLLIGAEDPAQEPEDVPAVCEADCVTEVVEEAAETAKEAAETAEEVAEEAAITAEEAAETTDEITENIEEAAEEAMKTAEEIREEAAEEIAEAAAETAEDVTEFAEEIKEETAGNAEEGL